MKVHRNQIPGGGLRIAGEEDCPIPELEAEGVSCAGLLRYALDVGINGHEFWASGTLAQPVMLSCVACLELFPFTIEVPAFAPHMDLPAAELINLAPFVREDLLLNLPPHPHCDRDGGRACRGARLKNDSREVRPEERKPDWSALDKLKLEK